MHENINLFNAADFSSWQFLQNDMNRKTPGKFKDETILPISHFAGLKSKMYSFKFGGVKAIDKKEFVLR